MTPVVACRSWNRRDRQRRLAAMTTSAPEAPVSTPQRPTVRRPHTRFSRATLFFAGMALFDVLIWTAAALVG
jgi:hypothetical protein